MQFFFAQAEQAGGTRELIDKIARTPLSQVLILVAICTVARLFLGPYLLKVPKHLRHGSYSFFNFVNETFDAIIYAGVFVFFVIRPFVVQTFTIPSGSMVPTLMVGDYILVNKAIYRYSDPKRGDIVVFHPPGRAALPSQLDDKGEATVDFVKRLIGMPGDVIEVRNDVLYLNGQPYPDDEKRRHFMKNVSMAPETYADLTPEEFKEAPKRDWKLVYYQGKYWPVYTYAGFVNSDGYSAAEFMPHDGQTMKALHDAPPAKIPEGHYLMMGDNRYNSSDGRSWGLIERQDVIGRAEVVWLPFSHWSHPK